MSHIVSHVVPLYSKNIVFVTILFEIEKLDVQDSNCIKHFTIALKTKEKNSSTDPRPHLYYSIRCDIKFFLSAWSFVFFLFRIDYTDRQHHFHLVLLLNSPSSASSFAISNFKRLVVLLGKIKNNFPNRKEFHTQATFIIF